MLDKFTPRTRRVILYAREIARKLGSNRLGTEHLLLALLEEGDGVAAYILKRMGLQTSRIRQELEQLEEPSFEQITKLPGDENVPFTANAKEAMRQAFLVAGEMGYNYIGTEHLLLGVLRVKGTTATILLELLEIKPEKITVEVVKMLQENRRSEPPPRRKGKDAPGKEGKGESLVAEFATDLTALAREGKIDPVIGRNIETERLIQILSRRKKNNPVLIGSPGVGKTAIVEGLAQRIADGWVPLTLAGKRLISLDLGAVVAGTKYRGQFEERFQGIIREIKEDGKIVLYIDELHTLVGAGGAEGALDASNLLKPALARGEIQCIGSTTQDEYRKYIEKNGALERRFQSVLVDPPNIEETLAILHGLSESYEKFHHVEFTEEALETAARLSDRYISDRNLPDKAIDIIDEAGSKVHLTVLTPPLDLRQLEAERAKLRDSHPLAGEGYADKLRLRAIELDRLDRAITLSKHRWEQEMEENPGLVDVDDIMDTISRWTGIQLTRLAESEQQKLLRMDDELHRRVVSQDEAINAVTRAIRRSRAGVRDSRKPIGSFLFLGPTGVGKTELAKALANFLFDDENAITRIDMSEYMEKFSVSRLIGAPPGYVGHEEGGQLTEKIRRKPYSVVLLDEIEKAHPDVYSLLLQLLDEGRLTDSLGRTVSFRNTVVIMTSNLGTKEIKDINAIGFGSKATDDQHAAMKDKVLAEVKKRFNPEFINRLDETVVFQSLTKEDLREIAGLQLQLIKHRLAEQAIALDFTEAIIDQIVEEGYDPKFGARPIQRAIQRLVEDPLAEELLRNNINSDDLVLVDWNGEKTIFTPRPLPTTV